MNRSQVSQFRWGWSPCLQRGGSNCTRLAGFAALVVGVLFGGATAPAKVIELPDIVHYDNGGGFLIFFSGRGGPEAFSGESVSGGGDVNGDGLADLIVGAPEPGTDSGETYLVFGRASGWPVDLCEFAMDNDHGGFVIYSPADANGVVHTGTSVSGGGDINGDGLADLIVGSEGSAKYDKAGECYVVFGKADGAVVDLLDTAMDDNSGGFIIKGTDPGNFAGRSVSAAGDVNGDGLADLIVGAASADSGGKKSAGESYVVFGKPDGGVVNLSEIAAVSNASGFVLNGIHSSNFCLFHDSSGSSVSGAGNVNGDGLVDVIIGAPDAGEEGGSHNRSGKSYVVFSPETPPASATYLARSRISDGIGGAIVPETVVGDSRAKIDFSDHDKGSGGGTDGASIVTVTLRRHHGGITNLEPFGNVAGVAWEISTDRTGWESAEVTLKYVDHEIELLPGTDADLIIFTAPSLSGPWTENPTIIDSARNEAKATVDEFGFFTLVAQPGNAATLWEIYE